MLKVRLLPWEYGIRNLFRRPARTALTLTGLTMVLLLIFIVVAFIRGLEASLAMSGDPSVVLVYSMAAAEDIENSAIPSRTSDLLAASLQGVGHRFGVTHVSPELYVGTRIKTERSEGSAMLGLVRGVTTTAPLLRKQVQMIEGKWPGSGEVVVGRLTATKIGCDPTELSTGKTVKFDGHEWKISGIFTAMGAAFESEIWAPLPDLQQALKRQDLSLVAVGLGSGRPSDVQLFCKERVDLELQAISETKYYASLQKHYQPVRMLGWIVVGLVASAGIFAGLNTMYGAVVGRVRELSTLRAVGFRRRAIAIGLVQEALLLSVTATLIAACIALAVVNGAAVRFTMGAFVLRVDSFGILVGCIAGLLLGVIGAIPPALKATRVAIIDGLKAV